MRKRSLLAIPFLAAWAAPALAADGPPPPDPREEQIRAELAEAHPEVRLDRCPHHADVVFVDGDVRAGTQRLARGSSYRLAMGDEITTGADGRLELRLEDGVVVRLGPDGKLKLDCETMSSGPRTARTRITLAHGKLWVQVSKGFGPRALAVQTGFQRGELRGTIFEVLSTPTRSQIIVHEGAMAMRHLATGAELVVGRCEAAEADAKELRRMTAGPDHDPTAMAAATGMGLGWFCTAGAARDRFPYFTAASARARASADADRCGAAGIWSVECAPEPDPSSCPIPAHVPAGTLAATGLLPAWVAASGGPITLTGTTGAAAGGQVTGHFDPGTCTATFRRVNQCGDALSTYTVSGGKITGTRRGGTTCCNGVRRCTGVVRP